jgi:parvulin-like peptidyl-prolyl isomerase
VGVRRWLREPLLHFLLAGAALYVVASWISPAPDVRVVVDDDALLATLRQRSVAIDEASLREALAVMPPEERARLVHDTAAQEALYREGRALGLDTVDGVVRLRTIQQMRLLLAEEATRGMSVSDDEVRAFYDAHREAYAQPATVGFSHLFFADPDGERRARAALVALREGRTTPAVLGDRFLYQLNYPQIAADDLTGQFGAAFMQALLRLEPGAGWQGVLRSEHGWHLVLLHDNVPAHVPPLATVAARIREAALEDKRARATDQAVDRLLDRYTVLPR